MFRLEALGWTSFFENQIDPGDDAGLIPARVAEEQRGSYRILGESGLRYAETSGRLRHEIELEEALRPCVGDWVLARIPAGDAASGTALIHRALARRTRFSRKEAGERTVEQVIAANIDTVFLVQSLNRDLNPRRLERYLALLWESGAEPVVVLSKSDLCEDPEEAAGTVEGVARGVPVHMVSAVSPGGLDPLEPYLKPGRTAALVGSSGVGKSTIVNRLLGRAEMRVREIREDDDRGRHTTTARHLVVLPNRGNTDRHARHANGADVGGGGGTCTDVSGYPGSGVGMQVPGLLPRIGAGMRGAWSPGIRISGTGPLE